MLVFTWAAFAVTTHNETEDSPLYAASMKKAYCDMTARDEGRAQGQACLPGGLVGFSEPIVVEGANWHWLTNRTALTAATLKAGAKPVIGPADVTYMKTCEQWSTCNAAATCDSSATCNYGTCGWGPTCGGSGQITCSSTCDTSPTCSGSSTCQGYMTCGYLQTCTGYETCAGSILTCGSSPTCSYNATCYHYNTCWATCSVGFCPAPQIFGVNVSNNVPLPGKCTVRMSFYAGSSVRYTVQYCTKFDGLWSNVFSKLGNDTTTTFLHTNDAPRAYYRILMQNP
jgi:hypothetical protein